MILIAVVLISPQSAAASQGTCTSVSQAAGACATSDGRSVTLQGSETRPGSGGRSGEGAKPRQRPGASTEAPRGASTATRPCGTLRTKCKNFPAKPTNPAIGQRDGFTVTGPVRLTDLIGFTPKPGVDHMEPRGWSVVGLDTNFFVTADRDVQTGMLLGRPASVRFTAKSFHWTYGDGSAVTTDTGGASWKALGLASFDPTPTSHRYATAGTYAIDLTIEFGAEYRYTADWVGIAGTIAVPANRLTTTVGTAKTVLVEHDCVQDPHGPGC